MRYTSWAASIRLLVVFTRITVILGVSTARYWECTPVPRNYGRSLVNEVHPGAPVRPLNSHRRPERSAASQERRSVAACGRLEGQARRNGSDEVVLAVLSILKSTPERR